MRQSAPWSAAPGARDGLQAVAQAHQAAPRFPSCSPAGRRPQPGTPRARQTRSTTACRAAARSSSISGPPQRRVRLRGAIERHAHRIGPNRACVPIAQHRHVLAVLCATPPPGPPSQESYCSAGEYGIRSGPRPAARLATRPATGISRNASGLGHGMCQKIATRASGRAFFTSCGSSARW